MPWLPVCDRFKLDYAVEGHEHSPRWRYCVCGWTEAHHLWKGDDDG